MQFVGTAAGNSPRVTGYRVILGAKEMELLLKKLPDEPYTSRAKYAILKKAAKPLVARMKALAPVSKKSDWISIHRHFSRGVMKWKERHHRPGELRRSIGIVKGNPRSPKPLIWVGPTYGDKAKGGNDGWYFYLVEYGVKSKSGYDAKPFIRPAYDQTAAQVRKSLEDDFEKLLDEYIDKHGPKHF